MRFSRFYAYWSCCGDYLTGYQLEIQALRGAASELHRLRKNRCTATIEQVVYVRRYSANTAPQHEETTYRV
jgi:hypothetical protein